MIATTVDAQSTRLEALLVLTVAMAAVLFLNLIPGLAEPFNRLFTMVHELGHLIATIFTGGWVESIEVYLNPTDARGQMKPKKGQEGIDFFVLPAGYLGVTLFSVALMLLSGSPYLAPRVLAGLGFILILLTSVFGLGLSTLLIGLTFGLLFIWVAWQAELIWSVFLLNLVAIQGSFRALSAFHELGLATKKPNSDDDASRMARLIGCGCSPALVVTVWFIFSIVILGAAFWLTWLRGIST